MSFAIEALSSRWRPVVVVATVAASVAHIPVIGPHLDEAPYMGVLFIVLTVACAMLATAALLRDSQAVYALVIVTCGLAVIGYAATRLVAFPMLSDDVGNWLDPLGVVSIAAESVAVAAAISALVGHRRRSAARRP
jgi:cytochrome bd-type quinol oxidase subunit 2